MRIPLYDGDCLIVPVAYDSKPQKSYPVKVSIVKPIAMIEIKSNGVNISILSRWALLKMLVLSFF